MERSFGKGTMWMLREVRAVWGSLCILVCTTVIAAQVSVSSQRTPFYLRKLHLLNLSYYYCGCCCDGDAA